MTNNRDIGKEILDGIKEIEAAQRGEAKLKVTSSTQHVAEKKTITTTA